MFIIYSLVRDDNSVAKILIDFPFKNINIDPIKSLKFKVDNLVKSPKTVMPDLIRHPEVIEFTGFRLSPE